MGLALVVTILVVGPGLDGRALLVLAVGSSVSLVAAVSGARADAPGARPAAAALLAFLVLLVRAPLELLDQTFFLAIAALLGMLLSVLVRMPSLAHPRRIRPARHAEVSEVELPCTHPSIAAHPRRACKSPLARGFRRAMGLSIGKYDRTRRLAQAAGELVDTDRALAAVASDAGFADQSHFTRWFRRIGEQRDGDARARQPETRCWRREPLDWRVGRISPATGVERILPPHVDRASRRARSAPTTTSCSGRHG